MTSPAFVAGQMVRIDAPGRAGHGKRGMVAIVEARSIDVIVPVNPTQAIRATYDIDQLRDADAEIPQMDRVDSDPGLSLIPDPRIAIAQALACELIRAQLEPRMMSDLTRERFNRCIELAAIGATELLEQLSKGK